MNSAFADAYNSRVVENLLALYEPTAVLVPQPGQLARGTAAIRSALQNLVDLKGEMRSENQYAVVHGDIALLRARFRLTAWGADGKSFDMEGHTAEVVRRQPDGSWLYIIDHAFGANPLP